MPLTGPNQRWTTTGHKPKLGAEACGSHRLRVASGRCARPTTKGCYWPGMHHGDHRRPADALPYSTVWFLLVMRAKIMPWKSSKPMTKSRQIAATRRGQSHFVVGTALVRTRWLGKAGDPPLIEGTGHIYETERVPNTPSSNEIPFLGFAVASSTYGLPEPCFVVSVENRFLVRHRG